MRIPLVADVSQNISKSYNCLIEEGPSAGRCLRATFIIDHKNVIRHYSINDFSVGREPTEILRLVKAFKFADEYGEVCPASWQPG